MRFSTAVIAAIGIKTFQSILCRRPAQYNTAIRQAKKLYCAHRVLNFRRFYRRMRPRVFRCIASENPIESLAHVISYYNFLFLRRWTRAATD